MSLEDNTPAKTTPRQDQTVNGRHTDRKKAKCKLVEMMQKGEVIQYHPDIVLYLYYNFVATF